MNIRLLTIPHANGAKLLEDLAKIKEAAIRALDAPAKKFPLNKKKSAPVFSEVIYLEEKTPEAFYLILSDDKNKIAFADVTVKKDYLLIEDMHVLPMMQGLGLGKKMLDVLIEIGNHLGKENIQLALYIDAKANSADFYTKLGFMEDNTVSGYYSLSIAQGLKLTKK